MNDRINTLIENLGNNLSNAIPISELIEIGIPAIEPLMSAINLNTDANLLRKEQCIEILGKIGGDKSENALISLLEHQSADILGAAIGVLADIKSKRSFDKIFNILLTNNDSWLAAARAVYLIDKDKALESLSSLYKSGDWQARSNVIDAIDEIASSNSILDSSHADKSTNHQLFTILLSATQDPNESIAKSAGVAFRSLGRDIEELIKAVANDGDVAAAKRLESEGFCDANKLFTALLDNSHLDIRMNAVRALGILGDKSAAEPLLGLIGKSSPDIIVAAIDVLGNIGDVKTKEFLTRMLTHPDSNVRDSAESAIIKISGRC